VYFISGDVARIIPVLLTDELSLKGSLSPRDISARYQDEDIQVLKTFQFITGTSNPIFTLQRADGGSPLRVIAGVNSYVSGTVGKSRERFTNRRTGCGKVMFKG
jgi:hypothetical protein